MSRMPDSVPDEELSMLRREVLSYAGSSLRHFRWRREDVGLYEYLVTEILLQQTRAETVDQFIVGFLAHYQSWECLQSASQEELAVMLQPLGLHWQRSGKLVALAQAIVERGSVPLAREELLQLPGVGYYVASAVAVRFGGECHAMLDQNMVRLLTRYFALEVISDARKYKGLRNLADRLVTGVNCLRVNWGLLDLAGIYCTSRHPDHVNGPLRERCCEII